LKYIKLYGELKQFKQNEVNDHLIFINKKLVYFSGNANARRFICICIYNCRYA
jgi:hypothetical protein